MKGSAEEVYGCARVSISLLLTETEHRSVYVRFKLTRLDVGAETRSLRWLEIRSLGTGLNNWELSEGCDPDVVESWAPSRVLAGEESPSEKAFSKTLSLLISAGPVMGPRPWMWFSWVSSIFARAKSSIIPCISVSPLAFACALAIATLLAAHPIRSRMKSIDLLRIF